MNPLPASAPILTCEEARALEARVLGGDEAREWTAMRRAGRAVADALVQDARELGGLRDACRVLVLVGKGHNGGDAMIAAQTLLERFPSATADVVFVFGSRVLRPLAARAWRELVTLPRGRVRMLPGVPEGQAYDVCLDGIFGFQFRPPAEPSVVAAIEAANALPIRLRAAVDLPSAGLFRADFTYATGSVKAPVVEAPAAGRVRYLDLGFFAAEPEVAPGAERVLTTEVLAPLAGLRDPWSDKRTHGHVFIVAGSRSYPGAALMATLAALRSGVGLVTACVPESLVPAFAARAPEAMWVGWPETPDGGLALEGEHVWRQRAGRATALVIGPGLGAEPETQALVRSLVAGASVPLLLDADALRPEGVAAGSAPRILTPHAGEFARIETVWRTVQDTTLVLKGPVTRIEGRTSAGPVTARSFFGGPVLARGGSGDLLAGLTGGLLAQHPAEPLLAAVRGVVWHGRAADLLARERGQVAVRVTELLDFLPAALRLPADER